MQDQSLVPRKRPGDFAEEFQRLPVFSFFNPQANPDVPPGGELVVFGNSELPVAESKVVASTKDETGEIRRILVDNSKNPHVNHLKLPHFPQPGKCVSAVDGTAVVGNFPDENHPVIYHLTRVENIGSVQKENGRFEFEIKLQSGNRWPHPKTVIAEEKDTTLLNVRHFLITTAGKPEQNELYPILISGDTFGLLVTAGKTVDYAHTIVTQKLLDKLNGIFKKMTGDEKGIVSRGVPALQPGGSKKFSSEDYTYTVLSACSHDKTESTSSDKVFLGVISVVSFKGTLKKITPPPPPPPLVEGVAPPPPPKLNDTNSISWGGQRLTPDHSSLEALGNNVYTVEATVKVKPIGKKKAILKSGVFVVSQRTLFGKLNSSNPEVTFTQIMQSIQHSTYDPTSKLLVVETLIVSPHNAYQFDSQECIEKGELVQMGAEQAKASAAAARQDLFMQLFTRPVQLPQLQHKALPDPRDCTVGPAQIYKFDGSVAISFDGPEDIVAYFKQMFGANLESEEEKEPETDEDWKLLFKENMAAFNFAVKHKNASKYCTSALYLTSLMLYIGIHCKPPNGLSLLIENWMVPDPRELHDDQDELPVCPTALERQERCGLLQFVLTVRGRLSTHFLGDLDSQFSIGHSDESGQTLPGDFKDIVRTIMRKWYSNIGTSPIHIVEPLSDEQVDQIIYVAYCKIRDVNRLTSNTFTATLARLNSHLEDELAAAASYLQAQIAARDTDE